MSASFLSVLAVLPFSFFLALALLRFAQGADRARAIVDAYLAGAILSYGATEVFGFFHRIDFLPVFVVWIAGNGWILLELWPLRKRAAGFFWQDISLAGVVVAGIVAFTLFVALTTAPNNWDSQTYHLPRIEHWIQDGSLAFYPTSITRQNEMGPVAEVLLLQTRILSGSDVLYPLVQWISMLTSLAAALRITRQLGGNRTQSWIAAVFVATLPIGILESTSTQNDYVVAALLSSSVTLGLEAILAPRASLALVLAAAAAMALSGMTKPIGFVFGWGFAVWFAIALSWRTPVLAWLGRAAGVAAVLAVVIAPFALRYRAGHDPANSGFSAATINGSFGVRQTLDNLVRHGFSNLMIGIPQVDERTFSIGESIASGLGLDVHREDTTVPGQTFGQTPGLYAFSHDNGPNPFHTLLIAGTVLAAGLRWRKLLPLQRAYWAAWLVGILAFAALLRFGNWQVRYHLPAFVLAAPLFATAWPQRWAASRQATAVVLFLAFAALPDLLLNQTSELIPLERNRPLPLRRDRPSYLTQSRDERLFVSQPQMLAPYRDAVETIVRSNASQIGLMLGGDSWEYPVWRMLRDRNLDRPLRIEHVGVPADLPWPLGPFSPEIVFWSGEEAPLTVEVEGRQFMRLGPPGPVAVYRRLGVAFGSAD
jgi:4-amino-4-deoxy-L-arabinose transferase-like glycosyltransferase